MIAGVCVDEAGFAGNLLAEIVGVFAGLLVVVFVVDRVVERERSRRWDLVSEKTLHTLRFVIIRAGSEIYLTLPAPRAPSADPYTLGLVGENALTGALRNLSEKVREQPEPDDRHREDRENQVLDGLGKHLALLRGGVMPQLLVVGEHDLVARLAALDGAFQDLEHNVWLEDRFGGLNQFQASVATVVDRLADLSEAIDETP